MPDLRPSIHATLTALSTGPLRDTAKSLLKTLGYESDRTLNLEGSKPQAFLDLIASQGGQTKFEESKALFSDWKSADILFQLSDADICRERSLFKETSVQPGLLQSYLFFAIELKGKDHARGKFASIARQINRVFPMPVMVMLKHGQCLSIAIINRRRNKVHAEKDVLEKVTLIRDISLTEPHRGHLDILASFAVENLVHPKKLRITDFDTLHAAWEQVFNVELLNNRFYKELSNWYFWALPQVRFPADLEPDEEKRNATGLIRLLTRLIFCWFLKEKDGLIPEKLFHPADLSKLLKGFDPESETSSTYYQAILQNLFFATLNQRMGKDAKGEPYRAFATDEGFQKNRATYDVNNLYRYEALFRDEPEAALAHFADIPFLNGGLFECLDRTEDGSDKKRYLDGFSRNTKKRPHVPDRLFFDSGETADLSTAYGDKKHKAEKVTGLITILNRYKFTIVENTPIDQEIALDPELLGKVFENLLASYNEETKTTARKQTGSFYTPRPIVDYMVDESLKAHLEHSLGGEHAPSRVVSDVLVGNLSEPTLDSASGKKSAPTVNPTQSAAGAPETAREARALPVRERLDLLFAYTEKKHAFNPDEVATLITAIDALKILDPACGSGAFPMGVLHKLVYLLSKLDKENVAWEKIQLTKAQEIKDSDERRKAIAEIMSNFADNNDDYGRKLYLIENCLYGVDIQPIAIQITKLRFFISLVCDQKTNRNKKDNHGIRPLPNLETKFVAADTLIGLPIPEPDLFIKSLIEPIEKEIEQAYHSHFAIQRRDQKLALQKRIKALRLKLTDAIVNGLGAGKNADVTKKAQHVAEWDAFDPQATADFFDPHWMFGRSVGRGFDIVVGNPPYLFISNLDRIVRENYARRFNTAEYRFDLYGFFIERAIRDLIPVGGLVTYIVPHTLLSNDSFAKLRKFLLTECSILQVIDIGPSVFSGASNETMTFLVAKGTPEKNHKVWVRNTSAPVFPEGEPDFCIPQNKWLHNAKFSWPVRISGIRYELLDILAKGSTPLGELCTINQGLRTGDNSRYIRNAPEGSKWKPVVGGKDIGLYEPILPSEFVLYDPAVLDAPRKAEIFTSNEKIIVQEIRNISLPRRIVATLDSRQTYALQSTNVINRRAGAPATFSLKYILAVMNSSVINYFFRQSFPGNNHIASNQLASIPIHNPSQVESDVCHRLVTLLLFAKADAGASPGAAAFLLDLIDACVMECYFREHMAERDLLFHDTVAPHLAAYDPAASETQQRDVLKQFHATLNASKHPIRNRLLRITSDSPDLLAIIKREGEV